MAATYPISIVAFTTKTNKVDIVDASHINRLQEEVVAEQTELGKDPAGSVVDLKTRLAVALADTGAIANGTAFPTSPTPINGQIFYRSDEDTLYVYDGTTWDAIAAGNIQIFTSSGTFTAPGGVTKVYLSMVGGGGSGGAAAGGGGGGGAGGMVINYPYTVIAGNNYSITIGTGGTGVTITNDGNNGGSTTFDTGAISAPGGIKGLGTAGTGGAAGGGLNAGNAPTAGTYAMTGGNGANQSGGIGGGGGGTIVGGGGAGGNGAGGTAALANTGGGGGGTGSSGSSGAGGSGICIVMF